MAASATASNEQIAETTRGTSVDASGLFDTDAFRAFAPLLDACVGYAELTGCRCPRGFFRDVAAEESEAIVHTEHDASAAMEQALRKAAPAAADFARRLRGGEAALVKCAEEAHHLCMAESVRSGIMATCKELGLWPPQPSPPGVAPDDCCYEDTSAPLPVIAQRAFNLEARRQKDDAFALLQKRALTASFLVDFAVEAGWELPPVSEVHKGMLEEVMARVEEWTADPEAPAQPEGRRLRAKQRAREALLSAMGIGTAADKARAQVFARVKKNWETPGGTALNVAAGVLAVAAGVAMLRKAAKPR